MSWNAERRGGIELTGTRHRTDRIRKLYASASVAAILAVLVLRPAPARADCAPGLSGASDRIDRFFDHIVADDDFDFHLRQKIDDIFSAPVEFGVAFLTTEALGFSDGNSLQTNLLQGLLHLVELEGLDDGFDFLHCRS